MTDWFDKHRLFHYTSSPEVIASILKLGFLLVPNKRELIHRFLPDDDFSQREPQEFGMVSFTELRVSDAQQHREQFGPFGVAVKWEWALRNGAQRVLYVGDEGGAVFKALKWLFRLGRQEVARLSSPPSEFMLANKSMAGGLGAEVYHAVLTLYEYMEPDRNSSQVEWRIVQTIPTYHRSTSRDELVKDVLAGAKLWKQYAVQIEPSDIEMFVCEKSDRRALREALPLKFQEVPIYDYSQRGLIRSFFSNASERLRSAVRRRERIVYVPYSPPKGSVLLPKAANGTAVLLPAVAKAWGVALHPTAIREDVWLGWQYQDENDELFELRLRVADARQLLVYLREMERIKWGAPNQ